MDDDLEARLAPVLDFPWEVLEYRRWLEEAAPPARTEGDYLFAEPTPRFEPHPDDVVVLAPDIKVEDVRSGVRLRSPRAGAEVRIDGLTRPAAERILGAIDGQRILLELEGMLSQSRAPLRQLVERAFGVLLFAPSAVERLERRLSGTEIVRFPGSPYEIERNYWENSCAVRERLKQRLDPQLCRRTSDLVRLLRELNVLMLMGADLRTYYRPASPIGRRAVTPGALYTRPTRSIDTAAGQIILEGPRVNASFVGGEVFGGALAAALGDPDAVTAARDHQDAGLEWGRVVPARAPDEPQAKPWFCPPRPCEPAHWERLAESIGEALETAHSGDRARSVRALARVHQRLIRLHPFRCANQSLAMGIVNHVLTVSHGAGMPHLWLDHLALRLSPEAYERAFAAAVEGYALLGEVGPLQRYAELAERKRRAFDVVRVLAAQPDSQAALARARECADAALALFPASRAGSS